jgi:hypothetical protein
MKKAASSNTAAPAVALEKLAAIAAQLSQPLPLLTRPGFSSGRLGPFLFLYSYAAHTGSEAAAGAAQRLLLATVQELFSLTPSPSYYRELAETGLLLHELREQQYLDESFDSVFRQLEYRLGPGLVALLDQQLFDPFVGYLPVAQYMLRRGEAAPAGPALLRAVVDALLRDYQPCYVGDMASGFWCSHLFGKRRVYLGWSHGLAAIILFLTQLLAAGFAYRQAEVKEVLAGAAHFLLRPHGHTGLNRYPDIVGQTEPACTLNLCYGDLGIDFALLQAGYALADQAMQAQALAGLRQSALRRQPASCNVFDASLIYGASGNALFFKELQRALPAQEVFGEAARYWHEQAQLLSQHAGQVAGYQGHYNRHVPSARYSLFEGVAGYGLMLLEFEFGSLHLLPLLGYPSYPC